MGGGWRCCWVAGSPVRWRRMGGWGGGGGRGGRLGVGGAAGGGGGGGGGASRSDRLTASPPRHRSPRPPVPSPGAVDRDAGDGAGVCHPAAGGGAGGGAGGDGEAAADAAECAGDRGTG